MIIKIPQTLSEIEVLNNDQVIDINNVKVYIYTSHLINTTPKYIKIFKTISSSDSILAERGYNLSLIESIEQPKKYYTEYILRTDRAVQEGTYNATYIYENKSSPDVLINEDFPDSQTLKLKNDLEDEHPACEITDRTIGRITATILAQDRNSQQITFKIKEKYDGVSILDESKKVYFDYLNDQGEMLSIDIAEKVPLLEDNESYILLKFNIPDYLTQKVGVINFALSVVGLADNYVWQTKPSTLTIEPNLGLRPEVPVSTPEELSWATELRQDVDNLQDFVGYQSDNDSSNDTEILFSGGGAPV